MTPTEKRNGLLNRIRETEKDKLVEALFYVLPTKQLGELIEALEGKETAFCEKCYTGEAKGEFFLKRNRRFIPRFPCKGCGCRDLAIYWTNY